MTCGIEPGYAHNTQRFAEGFDVSETPTLTEVSIAALTTEPELQNIGRSLISLARYHAHRMSEPPPHG